MDNTSSEQVSTIVSDTSNTIESNNKVEVKPLYGTTDFDKFICQHENRKKLSFNWIAITIFCVSLVMLIWSIGVYQGQNNNNYIPTTGIVLSTLSIIGSLIFQWYSTKRLNSSKQEIFDMIRSKLPVMSKFQKKS
jgi:hypothetical protein